jgi:DNA-binding response OmpR family regulator
MQALLISKFSDEADILTVILQHAGFTIHRMPNVNQAEEELDALPPEFIILTLEKQTAEMINKVRRLR